MLSTLLVKPPVAQRGKLQETRADRGGSIKEVDPIKKAKSSWLENPVARVAPDLFERQSAAFQRCSCPNMDWRIISETKDVCILVYLKVAGNFGDVSQNKPKL